MLIAPAAVRHPLAVAALLAVTGGAPARTPTPAATPGAPATLHGQPCAPSACGLAAPTPAELGAIVAEADRLLARYADDASEVGGRCRALGSTMKAHAGEVRMIDYMWRELDEDGDLAPVTGDAHRVEAVPGSGRVHIARGYDVLNPDRGLAASRQTARHEFAHLNGVPQSEVWRIDVAAQLATICGQT